MDFAKSVSTVRPGELPASTGKVNQAGYSWGQEMHHLVTYKVLNHKIIERFGLE